MEKGFPAFLMTVTLPSFGPALALAFLSGLVVLAAVVAATSAGRRVGAISAWARRRGFSFAESPPEGRDAAAPFLALLEGLAAPGERFSGLKAVNLARGFSPDGDWLVFDLNGWRESRFEEIRPLRWTAVALLADFSFPPLRVEPALFFFRALNPYRRLALATGDREFDRRFMVFGGRGQPAGKPNPAVRACLLALARGPGRWYRHLYLGDGLVALVEPAPSPPRRIEAMMAAAVAIGRAGAG